MSGIHFTYIRNFILAGILLFTVSGRTNAQSMYKLENDLFRELVEYQKIQNEIDSTNNSITVINNRLSELKKDKSRNESEIRQVLSNSIESINQLKFLQSKQAKTNDKITGLRKKLYSVYESKIDSLQLLKNSTSPVIAAQIYDLTDKKLLVQPKVGVLSIDPLRLLSIKFSEGSSLPKTMIREYYSNAVAEVDSHLTALTINISETENIVKLRQQTQDFLEESSFETDTRPMNLFSNEVTQSNIPPGGNTFTEDTRNPADELNTIRNTTLLGADTFAAILRQLSAYDEAVQQSYISRYDDNNRNISLEDYAKLLKETKNRLEEYRSVLINRIKLFDESD